MAKAKHTSHEKVSTYAREKGLSTLLKVSSSLSSTLDLADILQIAIESAASLLDLDTGAVYTLEGGNLYLGATTPPLPKQFPDELRAADLNDHPHIKDAILMKAPVYLEDTGTAPLSAEEKVVVDSRHLVSILYFPLVLRENAIGVFIIGTISEIRKFSKNEIELCSSLSNQASLAIANARLYRQAQQAAADLSRAYDATLEGWSRVLDMRDHVTDEHTRRVADMTVNLACKMGIPDSDLGHVRRGALLHDIGKMAIPDAILQKQGKLSDDEWEVMKTHPEKAYQILSPIDYLAPALDIPYCHHEKWDGTGYPRGLKGEEIPMTARLFAVVDVFDALVSDRPYRKAWKVEDALAYIRDQSGKHFFPGAVRTFFELMKDQIWN